MAVSRCVKVSKVQIVGPHCDPRYPRKKSLRDSQTSLSTSTVVVESGGSRHSRHKSVHGVRIAALLHLHVLVAWGGSRLAKSG